MTERGGIEAEEGRHAREVAGPTSRPPTQQGRWRVAKSRGSTSPCGILVAGQKWRRQVERVVNALDNAIVEAGVDAGGRRRPACQPTKG